LEPSKIQSIYGARISKALIMTMNSHVSQQTCQFRLGRNHLFMGSENRTALIMQFQLFAVASSDGFLGNVERR
jgi:hypothetical protein